MSGEYDDVTSPEFRTALDTAVERGASDAKKAQQRNNEAEQRKKELARKNLAIKTYNNIRLNSKDGEVKALEALQCRDRDLFNRVQALAKADNSMQGVFERVRSPEKLRELAKQKYDAIMQIKDSAQREAAFKELASKDPLLSGFVTNEALERLKQPAKAQQQAPAQEHYAVGDGTSKSHRFDSTTYSAAGAGSAEESAQQKEERDHQDGNKGIIYISDNVERALRVGPTVMKEYMENDLGIQFPESIIRHNANGGEYIPTRLMRKWLEENRLTSEQIDKLNALVDDRAAFNAKVKEINDRDAYVAPAPARDNTAAAAGGAAPAEEVAEQPTQKSKEEALKEDLGKLAAVDGNAYNGVMSAFQALRSNDDSQIPDQMMAFLINMMKQYGYTDMCQMANDGLDAMKVDDKTRAGNEGVDMAATVAAKARPDAAKPVDPQHVADLEAARKLLKEDPKKFKTAKEAYSKAAAAGDKRAAELLAAMNEVDKDSKEALKKQATKDKENADQAQQEAKEEHQKKSLKRAMKNRAHDVSKFFKKTFGIKTKKDKEKEAALAAEQQQTQQQAEQQAEQQAKAAEGRKITLEHDKNGNAVYTLSGYGAYGGDNSVLCDGKYTVHEGNDFCSVGFSSNDGNPKFVDYSPSGRQIPLIQTLKDEMKARSGELAMQQTRAQQQKTNS